MQSEPIKPVDKDNESDWSLSDVEVVGNMHIEEENDFDEPHSKASISVYDDLTQMSKMPAPEKPELKKGAAMHKIGKILTFVNGFMVVEATDPMVLDLDNYVFDKEGRMLGFVADVFGPVERPYYSVRLEDATLIPTLEIGQHIMFYEGSRLLGKQQICALKEAQKKQIELESQKDSDDQEEEKPRPTKRKLETNPRDEPAVRRPKEVCPRQSVPSSHLTTNIPQNMWNMQPMPQMPMPSVPNMMSPEQQMYLQEMYKQYYDQMMMFYNRQ